MFLQAAAWGCPELWHVPPASHPMAPAQLSHPRLELSPREVVQDLGAVVRLEPLWTRITVGCRAPHTVCESASVPEARCRLFQPHGRCWCTLSDGRPLPSQVSWASGLDEVRARLQLVSAGSCSLHLPLAGELHQLHLPPRRPVWPRSPGPLALHLS